MSLGLQGKQTKPLELVSGSAKVESPCVLVMHHHNCDAILRDDCAAIVFIFPKSVLISISGDCIVEIESMMHES